MVSETFLVRHGEYHREGPREQRGSLTPQGITQAERARDLLTALGTSGAVVLSSDAPRALETANIIGEGLGGQVIPSKLMRLAGENAGHIPSLTAVITKALAAAGINTNYLRSLILVNHQPLLTIATGREDIAHGEVIDYTHGNWNNANCQDGGSAWNSILREQDVA